MTAGMYSDGKRRQSEPDAFREVVAERRQTAGLNLDNGHPHQGPDDLMLVFQSRWFVSTTDADRISVYARNRSHPQDTSLNELASLEKHPLTTSLTG